MFPNRLWLKRRSERGAFETIVRELSAEDTASYKSVMFRNLADIMLPFVAKLAGNIGKHAFHASRKHGMFLPCCRNIFCFSEANVVAGNNVSRMAKLGNIGETCARHKCFGKHVKHVSSFCQAFRKSWAPPESDRTVCTASNYNLYRFILYFVASSSRVKKNKRLKQTNPTKSEVVLYAESVCKNVPQDVFRVEYYLTLWEARWPNG